MRSSLVSGVLVALAGVSLSLVFSQTKAEDVYTWCAGRCLGFHDGCSKPCKRLDVNSSKETVDPVNYWGCASSPDREDRSKKCTQGREMVKCGTARLYWKTTTCHDYGDNNYVESKDFASSGGEGDVCGLTV